LGGATIQVLRSWYSREHEKLLLKLLVNYLYYGMYAGAVISWLSQRRASVALSTTEAEMAAASEAAREVVWLKRLLKDIVDHQCLF
jgi:peptidase E